MKKKAKKSTKKAPKGASLSKEVDKIFLNSVKTQAEKLYPNRKKLSGAFNQSIISIAEELVIEQKIETFIFVKNENKEKIEVTPSVRKINKNRKYYYLNINTNKRVKKEVWEQWINFVNTFKGTYKQKIKKALEKIQKKEDFIKKLPPEKLYLFNEIIKEIIGIFIDAAIESEFADSPVMTTNYFWHPENFFAIIFLPPQFSHDLKIDEEINDLVKKLIKKL